MLDAVMGLNTAAVTNENALLAEIAAMRASLQRQRDRARQKWDACVAQEETKEARANVGRFTEQLLKGGENGIYS